MLEGLMTGGGFCDPFRQLAEYYSVDKIALVPVPGPQTSPTLWFQQ